jgi:hypothetical protein
MDLFKTVLDAVDKRLNLQVYVLIDRMELNTYRTKKLRSDPP